MPLSGLKRAKSSFVLGVLSAGLLLLGMLPGQCIVAADGDTNHIARKDAGTNTPAVTTFRSLPQAAQAAISASIGRENGAYHAVPRGANFRAANPTHGFWEEFTRDGVQVRTGAARWSLKLQGYGYGAASIAARPTTPRVVANRVEYLRGGVTEWYLNGPLGLEQGFTIDAPPGGRVGKPLTLSLNLSGNMSAALGPAGDVVALTQAGGGPALRYHGLSASDANGKQLRSWLELGDNRLIIRVDDNDARYPIVVDPFIEVAKLTALDVTPPASSSPASLGGVAISGDTIVVGSGNSEPPAAAYLFIKPPTGWATMTESVKLTTSDGMPSIFAGSAYSGTSVAISDEIVVVGAPGGTTGAAYVFVKPAGGWAPMTETAKLTASDAVGSPFYSFGSSMAISGDTVVIGSQYDRTFVGSAYVFVRPAGGWVSMHETAKLTVTTRLTHEFGISAAIHADTIAIGSWADDGGGAVYLFIKPVDGWSTTSIPNARLTSSDGLTSPCFPFDGFGTGVALSSDASTLMVGAESADCGDGAAYVFLRPAGGWSDASDYVAKLTIPPPEGSGAGFGASMALSGDHLVIGADSVPAAYVFTKPVTGWATTSVFTAKLTSSDPGPDNSEFSTLNMVGISGDTVAVGSSLEAAAYVFGAGSCDDHNPCTDDSGEPPSGCVHSNNTATCDDGNPNTTGDVCATGVCAGVDHCIGVTCAPIDQCHQAGTCIDHATGACSHPEKPNGASCSDGDACTQADSCQAGACVGTSAVTCLALDQCHVVGVCNPTTGACTNPAKTDGATCNDGNACTQSDACQAGTCVGSNPVTCVALDQCHDVGACNTSTGICSTPAKSNGSACTDGNACTQTDTCQGGVCQGTNYSWSGVLQPVNADGSSIFKLGSTVPVKFQLTGACSGITNDSAHLMLAQFSNDILGTDIEATSTAAADTGNTFRYDPSGNLYIFNLATKSLSKGTWLLRINLGDGVMNRTAEISLK
jgi:hypothetical protein